MKRFSTLAAIAVVDLGVGFLLQTYVLLSVGIGAQTDAHFAGQAAPLVLLAILQLPLQRAVVVAFANHDSERAPAVRLIAAVGLAAGVILLALSLAGPLFMRLVFPELPPSVHSLGVAVLRTQSVAVLFSSVNLILLALNQLAGRFVRCELSVLTSTIVAAAFVVPAVGHFGVLAASLGQVVKALTGTLLLTIPLRRKLSMGPVPWKEIGHVLRPLLSAGMFTKLAPIIDRSIGSAAASGSMSLLAFGQSIYSASTGIAERSIVAPRLPALKRGASSDSPLRVALLLGAAGIVLVIALVSASLVAQHVPKLVELVGDRQLALLTALLVGLAGFPVAALTVQWAAAAVVVLGRPDLSAKIVGAGFLVGVAFKYVGFLMGGIHGLAVGISMYYLLNALAFLLVLRRIIRRPGTPDGAPPASPGP